MGKIKDLSGKRFGKLTVLERTDDYTTASGRRKIAWTCVCDCGKKKVVTSDDLRTGHTKSCGCIATEQKNERDNLIGRKFGKLTVIGMADKYKSGSYRVLCLCDCGETIPVGINNLKRGTLTKCKKCMIEELKETFLKNELVDGTEMFKLTEKRRKDNTTGVKGVHLNKKTGKFVARIGIRGKRHLLGEYSRLEDAKKARELAEEEFFDPVLETHGRKTTADLRSENTSQSSETEEPLC